MSGSNYNPGPAPAAPLAKLSSLANTTFFNQPMWVWLFFVGVMTLFLLLWGGFLKEVKART